ncbi:MAG: hypothetical protein OZSIB_1112 [Candidatus Ozemobacter sibiricus]|uniref:Uncharacterized protein n=1 Tax=Candidatus Ozemobacter sibiricus TaxID=2268124 RepID=A0A367ZLX3_9BACT|nr:MAG: hypothetical protein OZSIB_1112 [Candidatus Ozemobacter sibiricus]
MLIEKGLDILCGQDQILHRHLERYRCCSMSPEYGPGGQSRRAIRKDSVNSRIVAATST